MTTDGGHVADFIETFCRNSKGKFASQPVVLRPWQREIVDALFELRPDGRRKIQIAYIGLPRKNGKSTTGAALGLYLLVADGEPGAEVYSCAGDRQQARIVFGEAKRMVQADPDLAEAIRVYRDVLEVKATGAIYRVLSADAALQQGLNPSAVIFDEVHVQPNSDLWYAMQLGMGTREQPLLIGITTAGFDEESLAYQLYDYGKRVMAGEIRDDTFYFKWYEPSDPKCDVTDRQAWAEANPALGDFLTVEGMERDMLGPTPENDKRRYRLNQWTSAAEAWLPFGAWEACKSELELDPALPAYVGIDVGLKHDSSAVAIAQKQRVEDADRIVARARIWENPYAPGSQQHADWKLNIVEVELWLRELFEAYKQPAVDIDGEAKPGPGYFYDPHFFERSAQLLSGDGLAMVEFPQNHSRMVPATQTLYELAVTGRLAHDGDTALGRHVGNVVAEQTDRGQRISKRKGSRKKIDAAVALAIAAHAADTTPPPDDDSSKYDRGITWL